MKQKRELTQVKHNISASFSKVKTELNEHLDAINQNTTELSGLQQHLIDLECKIDKVSERIDELTMSSENSTLLPESITLTLREQEVFLALYTAPQQQSLSHIAATLGLQEAVITTLITRLTTKGIPVLREVSDENTLLFSLDASFKDMQARKHIVVLHEEVIQEFSQT